jgi:hypothetical protein
MTSKLTIAIMWSYAIRVSQQWPRILFLQQMCSNNDRTT